MSAAFLNLISILLAFSFSPFWTTPKSGSRCFESVISFGDSIADTGNQILLPDQPPLPAARPPYGRTFFHHPTGRLTDGRVLPDFIAQRFGLPVVPPYLGGEKGGRNFSKGVNFAVAGATALSYEFYNEKWGIYDSEKSASLGIQWKWFHRFLGSISDSKRFLEKSLIMLGEIGANDYFALVDKGVSLEVIHSLAPPVINFIGSKIQDVIDLGARTILVPGIPPRACVPSLVQKYSNNRTTDKDYEKIGCVDWLNDLARNHNQLLQQEVNRIKTLNPHASIIYADYYNNMKRIYVSPKKYGFKKVFRACCGAGREPFNFNETTPCGSPGASCCDDPSTYVSWEGSHFTEAVYKLMAQGFLDGPYTTPQMKIVCPQMSKASSKYNLYMFFVSYFIN